MYMDIEDYGEIELDSKSCEVIDPDAWNNAEILPRYKKLWKD